MYKHLEDKFAYMPDRYDREKAIENAARGEDYRSKLPAILKTAYSRVSNRLSAWGYIVTDSQAPFILLATSNSYSFVADIKVSYHKSWGGYAVITKDKVLAYNNFATPNLVNDRILIYSLSSKEHLFISTMNMSKYQDLGEFYYIEKPYMTSLVALRDIIDTNIRSGK